MNMTDPQNAISAEPGLLLPDYYGPTELQGLILPNDPVLTWAALAVFMLGAIGMGVIFLRGWWRFRRETQGSNENHEPAIPRGDEQL